MSRLEFKSNATHTLGVELELQLVDADTLALKSCIEDVLKEIPQSMSGQVKPELMQSYLEINTEVCNSVSDVDRDLRGKLKLVGEAVERCGARLGWGATHPFSAWQDQKVTQADRYLWLVENLKETAQRLVTFGLHVHVGVNSGDKAIMICDRILRHIPMLLALSVNSPFWNARDTGLQSQRSKVMEGLPTAGLPPLMRNWSEYVWLINHLVETKFIETMREIWWDVRPHHNFGTVEVRICDMPGNLDHVLALTALVQCLVEALSNEIDEGTYQFDCHPIMVHQNKWRATRYGPEALLVDPYTMEIRPVGSVLTDLLDLLGEHGQSLKCEEYLEYNRELLKMPSGAQRQRETFERTGDLKEVVREMLQ